MMAIVCVCLTFAPFARGKEPAPRQLLAGAAMTDITPPHFPVIVNGMVEERTATKAHDTLMSRALILDDGTERIAIVVVDSLMLSRAMLDDVKEQAYQQTGIPASRMLISATHTHSAPSAMPCLGSREDADYVQFLPGQIVRSIVEANEKRIAARVGWAVITDDQHNHCRRWIFRSDRRTMTDPFGQQNVRAHMHPGHLSSSHIGPSGPADTDLIVFSVQTISGQPLAVLGNYAMHYYGSPLVSGDFCGRFGTKLAQLIGVTHQQPAFVGMMSQGTSGDSMWPDYGAPAKSNDLDAYSQAVAENAYRAYQSITYQSDVSLAMAETTLKLQRRVPDESRLSWARDLTKKIGDSLPKGWAEVYAFEQLRLHEDPVADIKLQAIRIGDFGITAIPDEVFGITGIRLKNRSPLKLTMNIELANGAEGYIPPPEQHALGGYTTWPARTAGLEVPAEPKIVETLTKLLEEVSGRPRRETIDEPHAYSAAVADSRPKAFWRLGEIEGTRAFDSTGVHHAEYEEGVAFYLPGPRGDGLSQAPRGNRAVHFVDGRVCANVPGISNSYSVECWIWNGLPNDARAVTGYFFSRGIDRRTNHEGAAVADSAVAGDHLGIGGQYENRGWNGHLLLFNGNDRNEVLTGRTVLEPRMWHHVAFVREDRQVRVYLNGNPDAEIEGELEPTYSAECSQFYLGGRSDGMFGLEGKLDEVALFDRPLSGQEIAAHYAAARLVRLPQTGEAVQQPDPPPRSPEESMKVTHVREGFELQLIASEPMVVDPVAIDWGPDGKLWVAEMADYPSGMDGQGKPGGRIRFLEDKVPDPAGDYDTSTLFLSDLPFPNGVMAWGKGVLITAAPEIIYAEDTDGDGRADVRQTLFSGFLEGNQQLRVNGLRWGLDNWVHCASGSHHSGYGADSQILSQLKNQRISVGSRDFRFRPDEGLLDPQSGPSQYGRNRDAWGNWFGEQNSYPLWHYVLEDQYIRRNPYYASPDPRQLLTPANPPVYAAAAPEKRFHSFEQSGRYTSACSGMVYVDRLLFPEETEGGEIVSGEAISGTLKERLPLQHAFTCEPFSNLVQHNLLIDDGVSFRLERDPAESETDFFASEDRWCRPVMVRTGPEGGLWVVDMYRYMIEHPHWLPKEGQDELRPNFRSGDDKGRIYRIVPKGWKQADASRQGSRPSGSLRMDQLTPAELVAALESSNAWIRDTAQRLLVAAKEISIVPDLERMAASSHEPLARLQATATLDGLGELSKSVVEKALRDPHPGVRRYAVRMAASAGLQSEQLASLLTDPSAKVRFQLAECLGDCRDASAGTVLARLLAANDDRWIHAAAMSSLSKTNIRAAVEEIALAMASPEQTAAAGNSFADLSGLVPHLGDDHDIVRALMLVAADQKAPPKIWQISALSRMLDALTALEWSVDRHLSTDQRDQLSSAIETYRDRAMQTDTDEATRAACVTLLLRQPDKVDHDRMLLQSLLVPQTPLKVQQAVVAHIGKQTGEQAGEILLSGWFSHSPALRAQILGVLSSRAEWVSVLARYLEENAAVISEIDAPVRQRLLTTRDQNLRQRLEKLFASGMTADRLEVLRDFQPALKLQGDAAQGAIIFGKKCATCHKQDNRGYEVGPNLTSLTTRTPEYLYSAILDPSSSVEAKYLNFVVVTNSGRSVIGMLSTETGSSLTLLAAEGKTEAVLRNEIEELRSTGKSLMPDGLEKDLSPQDLANLIEYVRVLKK